MNKHPESLYAIREGRFNGLYAIMTVNYALKDYAYKHEYQWNLTIVVDIKERNSQHLPTESESAILYAFEDRIEELLSKVCQFHFIGRTTWNGERTIMFYLDSPEKAHESLQTLIEETEVIKRSNPEAMREFRYEIREDEHWIMANEYFE